MKTRNRPRWFTKNCYACGEPFDSSRKDARLCSPKCRQLWSRAMRAMEVKKRLPLPIKIV